MYNINTYKTEDEFVNAQIRLLGFDEVERLLDIDFVPTLTNEGWRWIQRPAIRKRHLSLVR